MRVPDWALREILPALVSATREDRAPRVTLKDTLSGMLELARRRGFTQLLEEYESEARAYLARPLGAGPENGPD